jgi:ubiquinone biosynthesis monooxygenase Coq7
MSQQYSFLDRLLIAVDNGVRTLCASPEAIRPSPAQGQPADHLGLEAQKRSAALMRINHAGEVCAQALYYGQALATSSEQIKKSMLSAAQEETDHLAWCHERIQELNNHVSYLNPIWYVGSFSIGFIAGAISDKWSLGFVVETERQVEQHLKEHLEKLPEQDSKSRLILEQMCEEEAHHATVAMGAGAIELPLVVKKVMKAMSKVMTTTTYYI